MPEKPRFSLCPLLLVHCDPSPDATPLHFMPTTIAWQARWLTRLAAVPFTTFRFFSPRYETGLTEPLDLWFYGAALPFPVRELLRPVVIWSTRDDAEDVVKWWLQGRAIFVELVSERRELVTRLKECFAGSQFVGVAVDDGDHPLGIAANAPARIWRGYIGALSELLKNGGTGENPFSSLQTLAERDLLTPDGEYWQVKSVPDDFVVSPSRIIRNTAAGRLSAFPPSASAMDEAYALAAADAADALAFRGLTNIVRAQQTAEFGNVAGLLQEFGIGDEWAAWVESAGRGAITRPPAAEPPAAFRKFAPPQVVLVCTATSPEERAGLGIQWKAAGTPLAGADVEYVEKLLDAMMTGGRRVVIPPPANERQENLLHGFSRSIRGENEAYSAIAVLHASRFGAPVLKVPTLGSAVIDEYRNVNTILETSAAQSELALTHADSQRLAAAVTRLSNVVTEQIPSPTRQFLLSLARESFGASPLVHTFSDVPLEFLRIGDDYLGYSSDLSRTPLTPGNIPFINYSQTELTMVLPSKAEDFLIVTPLIDDPFLEAVLQNRPPYIPDYRHRLIQTRDHLFDALHDETVKCLVYFGHGLWDGESGSSALVLRDHLFTTNDVADLDRIPPVVILIGCNTAAAGALLGGFHAALFGRGAQLIVGTSFPVPRFIGTLLLAMSINNILSPGVALANGRWEPYRDLGHIMAVVRRRVRCQSDLYALWSEGKLDGEQMQRGLDRYVELLSQVPQTSADDRYQFEIEKRVLVELGLLEESSMLIDCGATPYPLFFQTLGFSWTTRNESWIT